MSKPLAKIPVGVVIERSKAQSQWIDFTWRPDSVLPGIPDTKPWTVLSQTDQAALIYAGAAEIELYPSETTQYRDNLLSGKPVLWVVLRATDVDPPYEVFTVTADGAEGEGLAYTGNDIVETVAMPEQIAETLMQFVTEHHVERVFFKRKRTRVDPDSLGRKPVVGEPNE
jgi:hypothetical protein